MLHGELRGVHPTSVLRVSEAGEGWAEQQCLRETLRVARMADWASVLPARGACLLTLVPSLALRVGAA